MQASATASTGTRTNTIAQGALQTSQGRTQAAITANLVVNPVLSVAKAVAPTTVAAGTDTRMTITLTRAAGAVALSGLAFTDTLPAGHLVSATPNLVNNCGGAVTATSGTNIVSLAGGALAGGAAATSCTILVNVTTPAGAGAATNTIAAGAVTSAQGFVNPAAASATITRVVDQRHAQQIVQSGDGARRRDVAADDQRPQHQRQCHRADHDRRSSIRCPSAW